MERLRCVVDLDGARVEGVVRVPRVQPRAPAAVVEVVEHKLERAGIGRSDPVLDMETLMFLAGAGFGATVGWLACVLMTPEREAEAQQAKCRRDGCPLDLDNIDR